MIKGRNNLHASANSSFLLMCPKWCDINAQCIDKPVHCSVNGNLTWAMHKEAFSGPPPRMS